MISIAPLRRFVLPLCGALLFDIAWAGTAVPAPVPPTVLYYMDVRDPSAIFGEGVRTWASLENCSGSDDLLAHLKSLERDENCGQKSAWVSTSQDIDYFRYRQQLYAAAPRPPRAFWVYEIQPNAQTFSVRWATMEYLIRNLSLPSERRAAVQAIYDKPSEPHEWAIRGGIPTTDIRLATRWDYNPAEHGYTKSTKVMVNVLYGPRQPPPAQSENPFDTYAPAHAQAPQAEEPDEEERNATYAYYSEIAPEAKERGTMAEPLDLTHSCAASPQMDARLEQYSGDLDEADLCPIDSYRVMPYAPATRARPSQLAFKTKNGVLCLAPTTFDGFAGITFAACNEKAPQFEYDEYKRLYVNWQKNHWCLAAPQAVADGAKSPYWDYVHFEPCAVNSSYQKWSFINGHVYSYKGQQELQEYFGSAILSRKKDGGTLLIERQKFAPEFFDGPSPSRSQQVELQMGWNWKNTTYYSNTKDIAPWSSTYWNRSYYDYKHQTISYIALATSASAPTATPTKYCLASQQVDSQAYPWDWTRWVPCNDADTKVPRSLQWAFTSLAQAARDPSKATWSDSAGAPLWAQATTHSHAGSYFTVLPTASSDYAHNSVKQFAIRADAIRLGDRFAPKTFAESTTQK